MSIQQNITKQTLYFLGGENVKERSLEHINRIIFNSVESPSVMILPWTTEDDDKKEKYFPILKQYFKSLGAVYVDQIKNPEEFDSDIDRVFRSNIIYLPGGLPGVFMEYASKSMKIRDVLQSYNGIIVGNSAGALVMCKEMIITADEDHPQIEILPGLGLVDFSVEVHYNGSNDEELLQLSQERKIYALSEQSGMKYDLHLEKLEFLESVYFFENGKKKLLKGMIY